MLPNVPTIIAEMVSLNFSLRLIFVVFAYCALPSLAFLDENKVYRVDVPFHWRESYAFHRSSLAVS